MPDCDKHVLPVCHQVMIVQDPANLGYRCQWAAALRGAYVATAETMLRDRGAAVKFKPALRVNRKIFISRTFQLRHPAVSKVIMDTIRDAGDAGQEVRWKVCSSEDALACIARTLHRLLAKLSAGPPHCRGSEMSISVTVSVLTVLRDR